MGMVPGGASNLGQKAGGYEDCLFPTKKYCLYGGFHSGDFVPLCLLHDFFFYMCFFVLASFIAANPCQRADVHPSGRCAAIGSQSLGSRPPDFQQKGPKRSTDPKRVLGLQKENLAVLPQKTN